MAVTARAQPSFRVLGQVEVAGVARAALGGPKQRAVLVYLLLHANELVPRDRLVVAVWGEGPPATVAKIVQLYVAKLRTELAGTTARIETRAPGYLLELDEDELDVLRFERLARAGREALRSGDVERASAVLDEALMLWHGEALADLAYEPVAQGEAARLEQLRLEARIDQLEAALELGELPIADLEQLVSRHPYEERLRAHLILALYRAGRQTDALGAYQAARQTLVSEIGVEPGPPLRQLEQAILRHDPQLAIAPPSARRDGPPTRKKELYRTNLPVQASPLVGRAREVEEIVSFIRSGTRLLTLTGAGGSGKTRLALHAAAELTAEFPDGVWFVPLAEVTDPALVEPTIAHVAAPKGGGRQAVATKRALLLLDNMEQVLDAGPHVADLLASGPDLNVIVTSRERLAVHGEQEYQVEPLPLEDAVELFTQCARLLDSRFEPDEHVAAIARRVDGLPLALELAAARTKMLSTALIREKLDRSLDLLTGGWRDAPERQRTLRATIEWSHALLTADERRVFARLGVFAGTFSLSAAADVAAAELNELAALVDKSLLRTGRDDRFYLLATIREFAIEQLAASGEEDELRERLLQHLLAQFPHPWAPAPAEELVARRTLFDAELEDVRATLMWLREKCRPGALELLNRTWLLYEDRGGLPEWLDWSRAALAGRDRSEVRADVLTRAAIVETHLGDPLRGIAFANQALTLLRPCGDGNRLALALRGAAEAHWRNGDVGRGRRLFAEALGQIDTRTEPQLMVSVLHNFGSYELQEHNVLVAHHLLERALAGARQFPGASHTPLILDSLGSASLMAGDAHRAAALYRDAILEAGAIGSLGLTMLAGLAAAEAQAGNPTRAALLWGSAQRAHERYGTGYLPAELELFRQATHDLDPALVEQGRALDEQEAFELAVAGTKIEPQQSAAGGPKVAS